MNKRLLLPLAILAGFALAAPSASFAAKKPDADKPAAGKTTDSTKPIPFHGKVTAVDAAAKTFSLKGAQKDRVFNTTDQTTVIGKDGAPAKLDAIPVGEEVRGTATKSGDTWTAVKVTIGAKEAAPAAKKGAKATPAPAAPAPGAAPADPAPAPAKADEPKKDQ